MDSADFSGESYTTTPLKSNCNIGNIYGRQISDQSSSSHYKTPVRCNQSLIKRGKFPKSSSFGNSSIKTMPIYSPPSNVIGLVRNPFEHACFLKERLSQPICSPSLFENKLSPVKDDHFTWSIEDISVLRPAPINENPSQEFDSWFSPATENEAQQAINKFFSSQIVNMESPLDVRQSRFNDDLSGKIEREKTDTWSQTVLTFPPNLPPEVEKILSAFYTFNEDQCNDTEDLDSSSCSISRKKLSFDDVQDEESVCLTPVQNKNYKQTVASTPITTVLSSPELSPITLEKVQDSPVDVSISFRSKTRLSLTNDVDMSEKENVQKVSWNYQSSVTTFNSGHLTDSAFSSV